MDTIFIALKNNRKGMSSWKMSISLEEIVGVKLYWKKFYIRAQMLPH